MNKIFRIAVILVVVCAASFVSAANILWSRAIAMNPASPSAGVTVTFIATFNVNPGPVQNVRISGGVDGTVIQNRNFARSFATGASQQVSFIWTATAGNHRAYFTVDPGNLIHETNEADNTTEINFNVTSTGLVVVEAYNNIAPAEIINPDRPDLIIDELGWNPSPIINGQMVEYRAHVVNQGNRGTLRGFKVEFQIICTYNGAAITIELDEGFVGPLGPGQSQNVFVKAVFTAQYSEWLTVPQACRLFSHADRYNTVVEKNEGNNGKNLPLNF